MTLKKTTLQQIVQQKLNVPYYSNLIRENETTFGENNGWKIEYYTQNSDYKFEIDTIVNGKLYTLLYREDPSSESRCLFKIESNSRGNNYTTHIYGQCSQEEINDCIQNTIEAHNKIQLAQGTKLVRND